MADISSVKLQDNQTYYFKDNSAIVSISRSGNTYTATRHDGTTFEFTQKDDNTTYTFENGTNCFTVTPSNGTAQTVTITPSIPNATQSSDGLMSATDKTKLDGVATGAEVNQNAFSNVKVGSTTLAADSKTDTLEFVAGTNITLEPTEASDKITISSSYTNTTYTLTQDGTDGHKFTLAGSNGYSQTITIPDANTTYTIEADTTNNQIKLVPSSGNAVSITVPFATNATNATNATKATQDESGNNIKATYAASFSISDHTITLKNKNGTSLGTVTVPDNNTTYSFDTGDFNGQIKVTPSVGSTQNISVKGLGTAAFKNTTDTYSSSGTDPVTGKAVASALETLPTPMVFKGTLGTGGTITQLPTASASTVGNTYRVITDGTYAGQVAKDGDEFIGAELSSGVYSWVYIPSADEPSGTVTSVGITNGGGLSVSGSPITTSGTITISHADTSSQASVDNSGRTYIQDISLDTYGHVTKITSATETVVDTDRYVNSAAFAHDSTNDNVKMTLTRAGSDTATVTANIPKVSSSSAGVAPKGAAVSTQSQSTKFLREDGVWAKPSYTTNTNTTYTLGTSGNTVTLTPSSGSVQSITVPFATNATNATKATQDANGDVIATTYRKLSNNDFDTINATEVNTGDLIVTGVGRFTNGLYGDLSGTATKVSNSLKIQLNGGTTEGTNQFTYDGSAAKTVNVTKSAIGLGNVDNTADANKSVASANTAGSATKATQDESGNNIKATYAASFSINDHTITLKNKNGTSLGTVTVPDNDTKNTAGSTDTSSKIFLIGATSQAANPQTYSHDTAYVGTDGCLYSGGTKVLTAHQDISGKVNKAGDTMTGQLVLASSALKTNDAAGWTMNQYGNLIHQRTTTTDYWAIANNAGTYKFQVYYETGAVTAASNVTAPKFIGNLQGTADYAASMAEANLTWGGKNFAASYGCIDAALMDELRANRLQFIKASAITVEYSRDAGSTWTDYGATDNQKQQIFAQGGGLIIGKADSTNKATEHPGEYQLRITIDTGVAGIYTALNKFVMYVSTAGSANCACKIQKALQSTPTTFVDHTDWITISGWSGYNVLNTASLTTYGNTASSQYGRVRFIFKDGTGGSTSYNGLTIGQIKGFGGVGWTTPSTMAKTGHLYSYNENQDAIFPNMVQAPYHKGTTKMTLSSGKITQLTAGTAMLFADGVAISNPTTANDVGWIRVLGSGESDTVMEIATGDDGGAGEQIVVRQYNTSSAVVNEATLLDKSGNTTFPKTVTAAKVIAPQVEGRITELGNYFNIGGGMNNRQTSADIPSDNNGGLRTFLATSSMSTGKPKTGDGHLVHFDWDNSNLYASQIAVANGSGAIEHRGQQQDGTWGQWYKVYSEYNKPTWSDITSKPSTFTPSSHTHPVSELTWVGGVNLTPTATASNQEWSIDLDAGSYTGTYWQIWSKKNSKSILTCFTDDNSVRIPNGDLVASKNITTTGTICVTSANSSWAEGIRINRGAGGYCSFVMGGLADSSSGTGDNVWWLGCNPTSYSHKWFFSHNGSYQSGTYLYVDSSSQISPHLRVGGDLAVGSKTTASKSCTLRYNDSTLSMDFIFTT